MARKTKRDQEFFRGDDRSGVALPAPSADPSIVRHILYLEGKGRETPYLSTSESEEVAERFDDNRASAVWITTRRSVEPTSVDFISLEELRHLLKGEGRGAAKWNGKHATWLVKRALQFAESNLEHLLDFRATPPEIELRSLVDGLFTRR